MKYIITESKLEQAIIHFLNKMYGDLLKYDIENGNNRWNQILFHKNDIVYMIYYLDDGVLFVDYDKFWDNINGFFNWNLKKDELVSCIKIWAKNTYNIDVSEVYENYLRQTLKIV